MHTPSRASRLALAAALLPVLATPALSHADETIAVDACIQTFLDSDLAKGREVNVRRDEGSTTRSSARSYNVEVVAKGHESGKQVARIVCRTDDSGTILAVDRPASPAVLASSARKQPVIFRGSRLADGDQRKSPVETR
jgi:predicted thioesterase